MVQINLCSEEIVEVFKKHCESKNYQFVEAKKDPNDDWRLDISNIREKTLVIIYHTGSVVIGGRQNNLRLEFENLNQEFIAKPEQFVSHEVKEIRSTATKYQIVSPDIRKSIREGLSVLDGAVEIVEEPAGGTEYRAKVVRKRPKVDTIFKNTKEIFEYFNGLYNLIPG